MRPWKSRAGQIVIPAMLLFPTLFLFVYLIYETAKLSREKIKHQFAMDAAAFVEATNYSDFLNRTAYVNGAFPMRIFEQGYNDFPFECEGKGDCSQFANKNPANPAPNYAEVLYQNGIFPRSRSGKPGFDNEDKWDIEYGGAGAGRNSPNPTIPDPVVLFTHENGDQSYHPWDLATEVYKLYFQVFSLLGSVEDAQWQVLKRLTKDSNHSFLQKSYWLNTGDPASYGSDYAANWNAALDFKTTPHCVRKLVYHGNKYTGGSGLQQYHVAKTDPAVDLPDSPGCSGGGLFQMQTVDQGSINSLSKPGASGYPGLSLSLKWQLPGKNYFNVDFGNRPQDFKNGAPELHTTVSVGANNPNAKVWPDPTPKFQVRQFP
ncbi:MAG: hypothetical protein HY923_08030 [Elusimicrobia bacterium]|nr:hypothetical protein [Elusimicrobiota bacterium]